MSAARAGLARSQTKTYLYNYDSQLRRVIVSDDAPSAATNRYASFNMRAILTYCILLITLTSFGQMRYSCSGIRSNDSTDSYIQFKKLFDQNKEISTGRLLIIKNDKPIFVYGDRPVDDSLRIIKNSADNYTIFEKYYCNIPCKDNVLFKYILTTTDTSATIDFDTTFYKTNVICTLDSAVVLAKYRQYCNDTNYTQYAKSMSKEIYIKNALSLAHDLTILALTGNKYCIDILKSYEKTIRVLFGAGWYTESFFWCYLRIIDTITDNKKGITTFH